MADKQDSFDPKKTYEVRFSRVVRMGSFEYLPRNTTLFKGGVLNRIVKEHGADVLDYTNAR